MSERSKGLAKTVVDQGKRIATLERDNEYLKQRLDATINQTVLNTALGQWTVSTLTPEQHASLEVFLMENNIVIGSEEEPEEEPKILVS